MPEEGEEEEEVVEEKGRGKRRGGGVGGKGGWRRQREEFLAVISWTSLLADSLFCHLQFAFLSYLTFEFTNLALRTRRIF